jgi:hypothetical protein
VYSTLLFPPCYSNLLLRGRRWTGILWRGVLGYVLPRLSFLWSYGVFRYSVSLRVITVFRDITYVIIILYSWHLVICEHFWLYVWNNWSWVMHTMSTWLWHKNCVWTLSADVFMNLQELDIQDFEQQLAGEQGEWPLTILIRCAFSFSVVHILACMP